MEKTKHASGKSAIEAVSPTVLLELLLDHSDIQVPAVTALACTSTGFSKALDEMWPSMMTNYAKKCQMRPTVRPPTHTIPAEHLKRVYPPLNQICIVRASHRLGGGYDLSFAFQEDVSQWTRQDALMTRHIARYMFFLTTADLERLDVFARIFGERCYRFEDVLAAGMLRYGRRPYVERLLQRPVRKLLRDEKFAIRFAKARQLRQQSAIPGVSLDEGLLWMYAKAYIRTGAGMEELKRRIHLHYFFAGVMQFIHEREELRVKHLQKAYAFTGDKKLITEANRIMADLRSQQDYV
jgi:hypothetical protein